MASLESPINPHAFIWEKAGVPKENLHRHHAENMQTPQTGFEPRAFLP